MVQKLSWRGTLWVGWIVAIIWACTHLERVFYASRNNAGIKGSLLTMIKSVRFKSSSVLIVGVAEPDCL
jgi:hypothetical protein